jgi:hypothetical protein
MCRPEDSNVEVLKTVMLYSSTALGLYEARDFFLYDLVWFSKGYIEEKFRISCSRWLLCFFGRILLFFVTVLGKIIGGLWNRQTFTVRHWTNRQWYIWILHYLIFLLIIPCEIGGTLQKWLSERWFFFRPSTLLVLWALVCSYGIPSATWKSEPTVNF